ncbi:MAG TPA: TetR/AcrR family transcriptional regulator [Polyangiaceae bacterium]|nr:TetR/AcrR family transcriptional regulator [Polyangiaceae bacterium]
MTSRARTPSPKAAPGRAGEPGEQRRLDLLEAAYEVVAEKGLEGLRTRDVAARAGVNVSTLHYYFDTKEALLVALVDHVRGKFHAPVPARRASAGGPALRAHFEGAWRTFQATPHLSTVLQELVLRSRRDAATRAAFRALHNDWNAIVEDLLRAAVRAGELRADLDPRAGARAVTSFIMGAMVQLDVNPKAFDFGAVARQLEGWAATPAGEGKAPQR